MRAHYSLSRNFGEVGQGIGPRSLSTLLRGQGGARGSRGGCEQDSRATSGASGEALQSDEQAQPKPASVHSPQDGFGGEEEVTKKEKRSEAWVIGSDQAKRLKAEVEDPAVANSFTLTALMQLLDEKGVVSRNEALEWVQLMRQ